MVGADRSAAVVGADRSAGGCPGYCASAGRRGRANVTTTPTQVLCNLYMGYFCTSAAALLALPRVRTHVQQQPAYTIQSTGFTRRGFPFPSARVRACVRAARLAQFLTFQPRRCGSSPQYFAATRIASWRWSHPHAVAHAARTAMERRHRSSDYASAAPGQKAPGPLHFAVNPLRCCSNILRGGRSTVSNWAQPEPRLHLQKREEIHHPHTHKSFR